MTARPFSAIPVAVPPADFSTRRPAALAELARRHGPVFKIGWSPSYALTHLVGPEANKFVFQTRRDAFSHDLGWTPQIGEIFGKGLLNMDDPEHAVHRRLMNPAFTYASMERYLPVMARIIAERCADWAARDAVDLHAEARKITFDVAAETLVGLPTGPEVDTLRQLFYAIIGGDLGGGSEEQQWASFMRVHQELGARLGHLIAARRAAPPEAHADILSTLVHARDDEGRALSDAQLLGHVNILLVAGHETSTTLAAWLLFLLARNPAYLARVREELDAALPDPEAPLTLEGVRGLRLLGYALSEAGRLYPPVALVPRGVVEEVEFGGYAIPRGAQVLLALSAPHFMPELFAEPERFDPDRFAPPREEDKATPYSLASFGGGPRICIGINFAQIEIRAMAAHILRRYDLEPVAPERAVMDYPGLLGQPREGIPARVTRRTM
jgi:cytochrome P450